MRGKCNPGSPWWYSPACRNEPEKCVPVVSAGNGYAVDSFTQQAAFHNMPLAIATAKTWGKWESVSRNLGALVYW